MSKYIEFILIDQKPKTKVFGVRNKKSTDILGWIKWYGAWRQYCFFPTKETIFNKDCMEYIIEFINKIMEGGD